MTIAFFVERARRDGTVTLFFRQACWLQSHGDRIVFLSGGGPETERFAAIGAATIYVQMAHPETVSDLSGRETAIRELRSLIASLAINVIVASGGRPFGLAAEAAVGTGCRVVYAILSNDVFAEATCADRVRAAVSAGNAFALTPLDAAVHAEYFDFDAASIDLVPLPIDDPLHLSAHERQSARERMGIADEDLFVLTAARLDRDHSGYIVPLIEAVGNQIRRGRRIVLVIAGDGEYGAQLRSNECDFVRFIGMRDDLPRLHQLADAFVGEGTSMLDAAAAGKMSVATMGQANRLRAAEAYGVMGVHVHGYMHWKKTPLIPGLPLRSALDFVVDDRYRTWAGAEAARVIGGYHKLNCVMPLFQRRYYGESREMPDVIGVRPDDRVLDVPPNRAGLQSALVRIGDDRRIRLLVTGPVQWDLLMDFSRDERALLLDAEARYFADAPNQRAAPTPERP